MVHTKVHFSLQFTEKRSKQIEEEKIIAQVFRFYLCCKTTSIIAGETHPDSCQILFTLCSTWKKAHTSVNFILLCYFPPAGKSVIFHQHVSLGATEMMKRDPGRRVWLGRWVWRLSRCQNTAPLPLVCNEREVNSRNTTFSLQWSTSLHVPNWPEQCLAEWCCWC